MTKRNFPSLCLFTLVFLFSGCSTTESIILDVKKPGSAASKKPGTLGSKKTTLSGSKKTAFKKSTVYFYRPDKNVFGWTWKDINIMEIHALGIITDPNEKSQVSHIGKLKNNSYFKKKFESGTHRFTANWQLDPYEFTLKPNEEVCIKAEIGFVNALRRRATLKKVDKVSCESDIVNAIELSGEK